MKPLTYSDYINDIAIIEALRVPQPPPASQSADTWPVWHMPGVAGAGVEWAPGDPWPRGGNWAHDEVLFIRTHQAFEIWFALILHELDDVMHRASQICETRGAATIADRGGLPRVPLAERRTDSAPHSAAEFPAITREADMCGREELATRIRRMSAPGRHQVETPLAFDLFPPDELRTWTARISRATAALRTTVPFFEVLSSMTPAQFLKFRGRLVPASGFGSVQFREIELLAGLRETNLPKVRPPAGTDVPEPSGPPLPEGMLRPTERTPPGLAANSTYRAAPPAMWPRVARRLGEPSLRDLIYTLLSAPGLLWRDADAARRATDDFAARNIREIVHDWKQAGVEGAVGAESLLTERIDELDEMLSHHETVVAALLHMHEPPDLAALTNLLDAALRFDAALLYWRDTHIRFVESMIGTRPGTGGGGIKYLRYTTDPTRGAYLTHAFPCLWQARSLVQKT